MASVRRLGSIQPRTARRTRWAELSDGWGDEEDEGRVEEEEEDERGCSG